MLEHKIVQQPLLWMSEDVICERDTAKHLVGSSVCRDVRMPLARPLVVTRLQQARVRAGRSAQDIVRRGAIGRGRGHE